LMPCCTAMQLYATQRDSTAVILLICGAVASSLC
jgi:hypothetical protein